MEYQNKDKEPKLQDTGDSAGKMYCHPKGAAPKIDRKITKGATVGLQIQYKIVAKTANSKMVSKETEPLLVSHYTEHFKHRGGMIILLLCFMPATKYKNDNIRFIK